VLLALLLLSVLLSSLHLFTILANINLGIQTNGQHLTLHNWSPTEKHGDWIDGTV
jgi:hypothetical protein